MAVTPAAPDLGSEMAIEFLAEYAGHVTAIRTDLLAIAKGSGSEAPGDITKRVLRAIHAVRGSAFLGLAKLGELADQMERAWVRLTFAKAVPRPYELRGLLLGVEKLQMLLQNPAASNEADIDAVMATLAGRAGGDNSAQTDSPARRRELLSGGVLRSLVVEDDPPSVLMLKAFLSRYGACDLAANGNDGVDACRRSIDRGVGYDLICMDVIMPETGGREAVRQIRELEEAAGYSAALAAKIVMMTAVDDPGEVIRCFQEFSDSYLSKPINLATLLRQLKIWELIP